MKKHFVIFSLVTLTSFSANLVAQSKFGSATMEELEMVTYDEDTTASAVILNKKGALRFIYNERNGFQYEYTEQAKIKILKSDGLDYANNSIYYYVESATSREEIQGLSGKTYNLEDERIVGTNLSKEHIFDEEVEGKKR